MDQNLASAYQVFNANKKKTNGSKKNKSKKNVSIKTTARKAKAGKTKKQLREQEATGSNNSNKKYKKTTKDKNYEKESIRDQLAVYLENSDRSDSQYENTSSYSDFSSDTSIINNSDPLLEAEINEEELEEHFSNTNAESAKNLSQALNTKVNKKRKTSELNGNKAETSSYLSDKEAKKLKKSKDDKANSSNSKSVNKKEKDSDELKTRRSLNFSSSEVLKNKSITKNSYNQIATTSNRKLESLSPPKEIVKLNSIEEGKRIFQWLLNPVNVDNFFSTYWEKQSCLIKREQSNYFNHLISFKSIDEMLIKNHVEFTKNIDVTSYEHGVRKTLNPNGRALPPVVWDHYSQGCSIRLLNPQTFLSPLYSLSATMQEYFHCLVGANAYLTPPNSQGFAPHYDDIEAFVLQIEGRKRWKLYKPRTTTEILPRCSSKNFNQKEIGKPFFEEVLEPGDVLYFPRGTIHQASTEPGYHSLHITLSVYQKQSFADLFEKMLPIMLQKAINSNVSLRRGLPLHAWQHAGLAYSQNSTKERDDLINKVTNLIHKCIRDMPLDEIMDAGIDQMAKKFQHEALPPVVLPAENLHTVFGSRNHTNEYAECVLDYDINELTNVRLLRANILRLVREESEIRIYYYLDNSKEYCEYEPNFIEIEKKEAASVEVLIKSYPQYIGVSQLPLKTNKEKIYLATALWERGLLMMEKPFR